MPGLIRILVGLVVLMGVAGGMDTATDAEIFPLLLIGVMAGLVMYSGVRAHDGR